MSKMKFAIIAGIVILAGFGAATGMAWAAYVGHSEHPVIRAVATSMPIPAARVGSRTVLYRDFLDARKTMRIFIASEAAKEQALDITYDDTIEQNIFERLVHEAALEDIANEQGVSVTDAELRVLFADVQNAASSTTSDIGTYLLATYGWDEEQFRQDLLRPALLEQKLLAHVAEQNPDDPSALTAMISERLARDDVKRYVRF